MKGRDAINERRRREYAEANARREARRQKVLALMAEWPDGMPPFRSMGADIGTLRGLVKDGLARELERDGLGDPRFVLA